MIVKTTYAQKVRAEHFAKRYVENNFNGTKTVQELYKPKTYNTANTMAVEITANPSVKLAIAEQMEAAGLTDRHLDTELYRITKQNRQLSPKLSAIVEANKLKSRYPKDSVLHQHLHLQGVDNSNIDAKLEEIMGELKELTDKGV